MRYEKPEMETFEFEEDIIRCSGLQEGTEDGDIIELNKL